jgi:hypothetical protein
MRSATCSPHSTHLARRAATTRQLRTFRGGANGFALPDCVPNSPHLLEHLLNLRSFWPIKQWHVRICPELFQ